MSRYRRTKLEGGCFFFTVTLVDRSSDLLVHNVERLRRMYKAVQERRPFETVAIVILPDHLHAIWTLPPDDADFSSRWSLIKSGFSRGLVADALVSDAPAPVPSAPASATPRLSSARRWSSPFPAATSGSLCVERLLVMVSSIEGSLRPSEHLRAANSENSCPREG